MAQSTSKATSTGKTATPPKKSVSAKPAAGKASATKPARAKTAASAPAPAAKSRPQAASATTAAKKAPAKRSVSGTAKAADAAAKPAAESRSLRVVTPEQRYRMICDAAYFRAERRGFVGGSAVQDWLDAEAEIDELLREMQE